MDSEKDHHMRALLEAGRPVTDEGPFYHHAFWEAYKGSVKGKLGGGLLGVVMGAITGGLAVTGVAAAGATIAAPLLIVGGFAAAGLAYGVHEFSSVGKLAGAVAATEKTAEKRMKAYEDSKFNEIKEEIGELKAMVKGEPAPPKTAAEATALLQATQDDYRTDHFQGSKVDGIEKIAFWKVALVGLTVGVVAGFVLAYGGTAEHVLHGLGAADTEIGKAVVKFFGHEVGTYIASMTAMGAIGASFGINRDIFRQIFDQTDLWFRGFVSHGHAQSTLLEKNTGNPVYIEGDHKDKSPPAPEIVAYPSPIQYPESTTYHRDKVLAAAREALVSMDHTKMSPH